MEAPVRNVTRNGKKVFIAIMMKGRSVDFNRDFAIVFPMVPAGEAINRMIGGMA